LLRQQRSDCARLVAGNDNEVNGIKILTVDFSKFRSGALIANFTDHHDPNIPPRARASVTIADNRLRMRAGVATAPRRRSPEALTGAAREFDEIMMLDDFAPSWDHKLPVG